MATRNPIQSFLTWIVSCEEIWSDFSCARDLENGIAPSPFAFAHDPEKWSGSAFSLQGNEIILAGN